MSGYQSIKIIGNLGRDPELRRAANQTAICGFSVAVNERQGDQDVTEWFNCVAFGKTAEAAAQYLAKGSQVFVEGRLRSSKYTGKDGQEKAKVELLAGKVLFLGGRPGAGAARQEQAAAPQQRAAAADYDDDDIPF